MHVQRWCRGLKKRGYEIKLVSSVETELDDINTTVVKGSSKLSYFLNRKRAAAIALRSKPDLVHVHYAGGFGLWGVASGINPLVVSVWGADIIDLPANPLYKMSIKRTLKRADRITATSYFLKKTCRNLDTSFSDKTEVIPFGVEIPEVVADMPDYNQVKICYLKRHIPKYGPDILLKALAEVKQKFGNIRLSLAGDGPMTAELKEITNELGLNENVDFVGFVRNEEVYSFIRRHHLMVMPSVMDSESFGVAAVETSACGRAVVASRIGGVPEVVIDGKTGILVEPENPKALADAIITLAKDPAKCKKMGRAGYDYVKENYDWEKSLEAMSELYDKLIYESEHD